MSPRHHRCGQVLAAALLLSASAGAAGAAAGDLALPSALPAGDGGGVATLLATYGGDSKTAYINGNRFPLKSDEGVSMQCTSGNEKSGTGTTANWPTYHFMNNVTRNASGG